MSVDRPQSSVRSCPLGENQFGYPCTGWWCLLGGMSAGGPQVEMQTQESKIEQLMALVQDMVAQQSGFQAELARIDSTVTSTGLSVARLEGTVERHTESIQAVDANMRVLGERQAELEQRFAALWLGHLGGSGAGSPTASPKAAASTTFATPSATPTAAASAAGGPSPFVLALAPAAGGGGASAGVFG